MPDHRDKMPSADDLAEAIVEKVEGTGKHIVISDTPPALRWIQRAWWQLSIAVLIGALSTWLYGVLARGWHW